MNQIRKNSIDLRISLYCFFFILLSLQYNLENIFSGSTYSDEILALFSVIYLVIYVIKFRIKRENIVMLIGLVSVCTWGILSNLASDITSNIWVILIDLFSVVKVFLIFIALLLCTTKYRWEKFSEAIYPYICLFIVVAFIFYILTGILDLNMIDGKRYNLYAYRFISENAGTFGYILMSCLGIVLTSNKRSSKIITFISLFMIAMTTKGPQMIFTFIFITLYYFFKKESKIRWYHIGVISLLIFFIGGYQINEYLTNDTSARFYLIKHSLITAKNYFPFGSGFATYGSEMSRRFYSPLYQTYGFDKIWGLNQEYSWFINDNYWAMILGQLGWISFIVMIIIYIRIYKMINNCGMEKTIKAYCLALFISYMVGSIGSAYLTSFVGVLSFAILGAIIGSSNNSIQNKC